MSYDVIKSYYWNINNIPTPTEYKSLKEQSQLIEVIFHPVFKLLSVTEDSSHKGSVLLKKCSISRHHHENGVAQISNYSAFMPGNAFAHLMISTTSILWFFYEKMSISTDLTNRYVLESISSQI